MWRFRLRLCWCSSREVCSCGVFSPWWSSMASRDDSRVVFVGNIPYDGTEQQLAEQFSEVGTVVSFRLVNDRETGKPKGFGFCEYKDAETARSAIRNLNGINFHGRPLRVDTADDDQAGSHFGRGMQGTPAPAAGGPAGAPPSVAKERMGVDAIGAVVDSLSNEQQCEVLSQMKQLIASDPDGARRLLHENQQLAQAMLRILVIFDAVKPEDIQSLSAVTVPPIAPPAEFPPGPLPPRGQYDMGPLPPQQAPPAFDPRRQPPAFHGGPPPPVRQRRPMPSLPPQKAQLLQTIMTMSPEQLATLSPEMQQQVAVLRQRMGAAGRPAARGPPRGGYMGGPPPPQRY
ncbi:RRM domain-containing protein [Plasmodiophora brassicae]|uniref:RRM domain-containing protein n=1 Tax=Plasmodiophora brassicae TaxID=37360 RepID=A0A0G4J8B1_PLABS|nr:hypothetical protein PBRA_003344 [Plasmodiophora brassicae]SPQ99697.1 unnamed protein product [Plasmodiophora brassicae]